MIDHGSRLDRCRRADVTNLLQRAFTLIHLSAVRGDTGTAAHHFRDAMHVATAIRYGRNGLVTVDNAVLRATNTQSPHTVRSGP